MSPKSSVQITIHDSETDNFKANEKIQICVRDLGMSVMVKQNNTPAHHPEDEIGKPDDRANFLKKIFPRSQNNRSKKAEMVSKPILNGITGVFNPGRLIAVMGASGAGKTSLLNCIAGSTSKTSIITGEIGVNGILSNSSLDDSRTIMKSISAYVYQDDIILDTMTVKEAVLMSAILRLSKNISLDEKKRKVDHILGLLRLSHVADTVIGNAQVKGISGGERKRTALAMELVSDPQLLFCDEPTSGLDSFSAFNVVDILKNLTRAEAKTVICTIHQPSSETFHMFDDLCLLADGKVIYFGPINECVGYFSQIGFKCPPYTNPADYLFMNVLNTENSDQNTLDSDADEMDSLTIKKIQEKNLDRIQYLINSWEMSQECKEIRKLAFANSLSSRKYEVDELKRTAENNSKAEFVDQFKFLLGRASKNAWRNKFIIQVKLFQSIFVALLIGLIYFDVGRLSGQRQVQNITGVMFFAAVNQIMSYSIGILSIFALEKAVFIREYGNGYYDLGAYFWSKTLVELPIQVILPFIMTCILYWMVGLNTRNDYAFIVFALTLIIMANCGSALGIFFASIFSDLTVALAVTPMVLLPLMIFSGLFVNNESIPVYFDWIKYLSPIKYGFEALVKNELNGWVSSQTIINPINNQEIEVKLTGDEVLKDLGFYGDNLSVAICLVILVSLYVVLLILAYFALRRASKLSLH